MESVENLRIFLTARKFGRYKAVENSVEKLWNAVENSTSSGARPSFPQFFHNVFHSFSTVL